MEPTFAKVLIVEDDASLGDSLSQSLAVISRTVIVTRGLSDTEEWLSSNRPDLILLDMDLSAGKAFSILAALEVISPAPVVVGMSAVAGPEDVFRLGERGVWAYLHKPFLLSDLAPFCKDAANRPPNIRPLIRQLVGHSPLSKVESEVRTLMVTEALARARGSRRAAAKMLAVSRQMLQHVLRKGHGGVEFDRVRASATKPPAVIAGRATQRYWRSDLANADNARDASAVPGFQARMAAKRG